MTLDFRYKDFVCTYYSGKRYIKTICFSLGCDDAKYGKYAHITYHWPKQKQDQLNYCFFDKPLLFEYFSEISKILGFRLISFTETKNSYKLQIECIHSKRYFIYVSMCIRYVYEHPFAVLLLAAWNNKHNFPELDIIQIMQFYIAAFFNGRRCHCPGLDMLAFQNINSKCQFSILKNNFNNSSSFYKMKSNHTTLTTAVNVINTKQLPQIISGINSIANTYYVENKENICRW